MGLKRKQKVQLPEITVLQNSYATMMFLQDIAFFHGADDAKKFCDQIVSGDWQGPGTVRSMIGTDPIFIGAVFDDPWCYFGLDKQNQIPHLDAIALFLSCGWNRSTMPKELDRDLKRSRKYRSVFAANEINAVHPWRIQLARRLVKEHYAIEGHAFIHPANLSILIPETCVWFSKYVEYLQQYQLASKFRIKYMKRFIRENTRANKDRVLKSKS